MQVVLCGPSGARCGVCVTTTLWALGFRELGVDLRWITNLPLVDTSPRYAPIDPLVEDVRRFEAYKRPDAVDITQEQERDAGNVWCDARDGAFDTCGPGDVFFLDQSGSVIDYGRANDLISEAHQRGLTVFVRLHSQLLQGLTPKYVDAFVAPFEKIEADVLSSSEVQEIDSKRWHVVPHPCGLKVAEPDIARKHVIGYGQTHRMDHRYIQRAVEDAGYVYTTLGTGEEWLGIDDLLHGLSEAQAIVLFYSPLKGIGRSSALNLVLGAQRPVFVSDSLWLKDAEQWGGVCDDAEMVMRGIAVEREPNESQRTYYACWNPKAAAQRILEIAMESV